MYEIRIKMGSKDLNVTEIVSRFTILVYNIVICFESYREHSFNILLQNRKI